MVSQNGHETTEGCGLVYWAGRLSQQVFQSLLNEAAGIIPPNFYKINERLSFFRSTSFYVKYSNSPYTSPNYTSYYLVTELCPIYLLRFPLRVLWAILLG